ncbi:MAG: hypothetical protein ACL7AX_06310 [Candidatus Arsenophonus phytopathogenicus]
MNVNNADMTLVVDKFNSVNSEIRFKDSNVIISTDHFVNKLTFPDNEKFSEIGGFIYLANSIYWRKNNNVVADGSIAHLLTAY